MTHRVQCVGDDNRVGQAGRRCAAARHAQSVGASRLAVRGHRGHFIERVVAEPLQDQLAAQCRDNRAALVVPVGGDEAALVGARFEVAHRVVCIGDHTAVVRRGGAHALGINAVGVVGGACFLDQAVIAVVLVDALHNFGVAVVHELAFDLAVGVVAEAPFHTLSVSDFHQTVEQVVGVGCGVVEAVLFLDLVAGEVVGEGSPERPAVPRCQTVHRIVGVVGDVDGFGLPVRELLRVADPLLYLVAGRVVGETFHHTVDADVASALSGVVVAPALGAISQGFGQILQGLRGIRHRADCGLQVAGAVVGPRLFESAGLGLRAQRVVAVEGIERAAVIGGDAGCVSRVGDTARLAAEQGFGNAVAEGITGVVGEVALGVDLRTQAVVVVVVIARDGAVGVGDALQVARGVVGVGGGAAHRVDLGGEPVQAVIAHARSADVACLGRCERVSRDVAEGIVGDGFYNGGGAAVLCFGVESSAGQVGEIRY